MTLTTTAAQGILEYVDPAMLTIEQNVRTDIALDESFVESIRVSGVMTPILGHRDQAGNLHVRAGQRRTRAAREAGLDQVPVYVVDGSIEEVDRIIEQLTENDQRQELGEADRIEAWKQLSFEGLSITEIAKRTGAKRDRVKVGVGVAGTQTGTALVSQGVTLDQAAEMLEFEDDAEAMERIMMTVREEPDYFEHRIARERSDKADRVACLPLIEEAHKNGWTVLTDYPTYGEAPYPIQNIRKEDGARVTSEDLVGKAGISVLPQNTYNGPAFRYYVNDPAQLGYAVDQQVTQSNSGPMTDEQKAERKALIENNKDWDAAESVRRDWLQSLIERKALPKDVTLVTAEAFAYGNSRISQSMGTGNSLAKKMLGIESTQREALPAYLLNHPNKAQHVTLAIAFAGIEDTTHRGTWRYPSDETALYLQALARWGYTLSPVEKIAAKSD